MAEFTDRIKLVFDAVTSDATSGVGKLKSGVGEAEGGFAKLKAGAGGALDMIRNNAALSAGAAGLAVGKFIADAIGGFQEAALEANNFGDAVGLSVEDASRWIEVAGDLGVNVDALQGAVGKLNIATANGVLDKLGVGGETTNERLINALQHLQGIPNAADRAKEGMALFGKSWTALVPLVETAGDLRTALADVSGGQLKTEEDVAAAKRLRDAVDTLSDVFDRFMQTVGGAAIGAVSGFAEGLGNLAEQAEKLSDMTSGLGDIGSAFSFLNPISQVNNLADAFSEATDFGQGWEQQLRGTGEALAKNIPVVGGWASSLFGADHAQEDAEKSAKELEESQKAAAIAAKEQAEANDELAKALRGVADAQLASISSALALADAGDRTTDAVAKYDEATRLATEAGGANTAANDEMRRSMNDAEQAALAQAAAAVKVQEDNAKAAGGALALSDRQAILQDSLRTTAGTMAPGSPLRQHLLEYANSIDEVPTEKSTTFHAETDEATRKINALSTLVRNLATNLFGTLGAIGRGETGLNSTAITSPESASAGAGTLSAVPSVALASAAGPSMRALSAPGVVNNISVTVAPFTSPAEVGRSIADYLDAFYRRSGTRARAVA